MKKSLAIVAVAAAVIIASCGKKDDVKPSTETPKAKTKTEMLTAGKWQISGGTYKYNIMGMVDSGNIMDDMDACEKDNFVSFGTDGIMTSDEGATKCDAADPQTTKGKWAFISNETKIEWTDEDGYKDTMNIDELTESVFSISQSYTEKIDTMEMSSSTKIIFKRIN